MIGIGNHTADTGQHIEQKEARTDNSTYPKGGVSCSVDTYVQAESSVLRMKFWGKSPALRVAAKRYVQPWQTEQN